MSTLRSALVALLVALIAAPAQAQRDTSRVGGAAPAAAPPMSEVLGRIGPGANAEAPAGRFGLDGDCASFADDTTRQRCWAAYQAFYGYYDFGLTHRRNVFWWTHWSSRVIFVVVLGLVFAGMYFAWLQFRQDLAPAAGAGEETRPAALHQVEIGKSGIKVSSPVLGVIILVISLAFFYLYLVHVYPIVEIL